MIQILTDGMLAYDSRLPAYGLTGLKITTGLNKGGTAEIVMPSGHPAYDFYTSFRTIVEVYRDGALQFRGRALYPKEDFYNTRTVTCEGELCFLADAVCRPYIYQTTPEDIFRDLIAIYNSQVDAFKAFRVGTVTVTDPNDYVRLESETAEPVGDVLSKLLERCGGYITFTTGDDGARYINWLEEIGTRSGQVIEFGANLLSFARDGSSTELATAILPYGAKNETTGERVTIESVNEGLDYIKDDEAVELRGMILKAVYWDDVTEPANLLRKARQYLAESRNIITALELSAVDLSYLDMSIDSYQVGDTIRVRSIPHKVDEEFQLTERTEDLLNPDQSTITLGKELASLTGADVAGDHSSANLIKSVVADYTLNTAIAIAEAQRTLTALINQTAEAIRTEVTDTTITGDEVSRMISTSMEQLSDSFTFTFEGLQEQVTANKTDADTRFDTWASYIRFEDGDIILGEEGNSVTLRLQNDRISILDAGAEVMYINKQTQYITDGHFSRSLRIGAFSWQPRENGNLSLVKAGED